MEKCFTNLKAPFQIFEFITKKGHIWISWFTHSKTGFLFEIDPKNG